MRRFQSMGVAVAVVVATVGGTFVLVRAFDDDEGRLGRTGPMPFPAANGLIVYTSRQSGNYDIWTAGPDGTRADNITAESDADETDPAWAPDGNKIAFVSNRDGDHDIYLTDPEGTDVLQLTDSPGDDYGPAWSPDGTKIAYSAGGDLFVMNADGSLARKVTTSGPRQEHHNPAWAPDGSRIAFLRYTVSKGSSEVSFPDSFYESFTGSGIYVVALDGGGLTRLTESPLDPGIYLDGPPDWSPDGTRIAFERGGDVYVMAVDGSSLHALTDDHASYDPAWSPDGRRIVFTRMHLTGDEFPQLHVMEADGSRPVRLRAPGFREGGGADWQPVPAAAGPSPTSAPSPLPEACDASQVTGNFDGDGEPDTATVAKTECLIDPAEQGDTFDTEYSFQVRLPPSEGIAPLPDCKKACRAVAATDLNGDGIDEFILSASTRFFQVYELPASQAFGRPATVARPGAPPRWAADQPAEFGLFSSQTHYDVFGCDLINHRVIVLSVALNPDQAEWKVHETLLKFDPTEMPPFGQFTVVSERDYAEPFEEGVGAGDQFEPGDPCWD